MLTSNQQKLTQRLLTFRRRSHTLAVLDAWKLMLREQKPGELTLRFKTLNRDVVLRTGSSDVACFEKVFIDREYADPFETTPLTIVDAGANIGMASLFFSENYPDARILAIEPEPSNVELLRKNCAGLPNLTIVQAAVWPVKKDLAIKDPGAEKWAFSVAESNGNSSGKAVKIPAITIPEIIDRFGFERINLLKLDIEGAEKELFARDAESWMSKVDLIVIELHDRYVQGCSQEFYRALQAFDFQQEVRGENLFVQLRP